jgi:PIN domain nuclease of toxin-antitoxin system
MTSAVLDSSAILAVLNNEPGADAVVAVLDDALVSTVNYAEVVTKLVDRGSSSLQAQAALRAIALTTVDLDTELARRTGELRAETKGHGLSLGDRACLSLAEREGVPAMTGDRNWLGAVAKIKVHVFR